MIARLHPGVQDRGFLRRLALIVIVLALVVFLVKITDLLLLVFGSTMLAVLLSGVADCIAGRTPLGRKPALAITILLLLGFLFLTGWLFGAQLSTQFNNLMAQLPGDWADIQARLSDGPLGRMLLDAMRDAVGGSRLAVLVAGIGVGSGEIIVNFVIVLIGGFFIAAQPSLYRRGAILLAPPKYRSITADVLDDCGRTLKLWLLTQLVLMTTMGLLVGFGLWLAGVPSAAALGLLAALSEFIPYVGPTLAMVPALVIAATVDSTALWGTLATYALVRLVQSNFITPMVQRRVVSVPPAVTLFAILAFGYAFGVFGLFFSAPLLVVAYTLVGRLYLRETLGEGVSLPGEE